MCSLFPINPELHVYMIHMGKKCRSDREAWIISKTLWVLWNIQYVRTCTYWEVSTSFQRHLDMKGCNTFKAWLTVETSLTFSGGLLKACWLSVSFNRNSLVVSGHVILENKCLSVRALLTKAINLSSQLHPQPITMPKLIWNHYSSQIRVFWGSARIYVFHNCTQTCYTIDTQHSTDHGGSILFSTFGI